MDEEKDQKNDSQDQQQDSLTKLEESAEQEEEQVGKPNPNPYFNPKQRGLLFHFLISFVAGIVASSIVVLIYATYAAPKIPKFYSFDLSTMVQQKEVQILKHPNQNMKAEIDAYINDLQKYINSYASHGIVFVTGVSIGNSPYVTDITKNFAGTSANATSSKK